MVKSQIKFNEEYSKEKKIIRVRDENNFQGSLIIEDYPNLEKLYLREVKSVDKVILKNLTQLQECTILECDTKELVIDNCSQIKKLNIESNLLTSLEFLKDLEHLEELEVDGNTELIKILEPYKGDWRIYKKIIQGSNKEIQELLRSIWEKEKKDLSIELELSQQKYDELKKFLNGVLVSLSQEAKKKLVGELNKKIEEGNLSAPGMTKELMLNTKEVIKSVKEIKEKLEEELKTKSDEIRELEKQFQEKEERINRLELQIRELTELSEEQRRKIQFHLKNFGSEQELLRELIIEYSSYVKFKKQELDSENYFKELRKYEKCYQKKQDELENKLKEEDKYKVPRILIDCEKWFEQELEKKATIDNSKLLLIEGKEYLSKVPDSGGKEKATGRLKEKEEKIEKQSKICQPINQQINNFFFSPNQSGFNFAGDNANQSNQFTYHIQYNQSLTNQELTELEQRYQALEPTNEPISDPQKLKKSILFLGTKQIFATTRQDTINNLIKTYEITNKSGKRYEKITLVGGYIGEVGEVAASIVPGGSIVAKVINKGIPIITNLLKNYSHTNYAKKFENYLMEDEKGLFLLEKTYQSLISSQDSQNNSEGKINPILTNLLKLNQGQFGQHDVFEVSKLQKEEKLTSEKMQKVIELLTSHLKDFTKELQQETSQYAEKMEEIFTGVDGNRLQSELTELLERLSGKESRSEQVLTKQVSLEEQIQFKKDQLEQLKSSVKDKLKSRLSEFPLVGEIRTEKWQSRLEKLLDRQDKIIRWEDSEKLTKVKEQLKEKLTKEEEINNLCRIQIELTQLRIEQEKQQAQIEQAPKDNN